MIIKNFPIALKHDEVMVDVEISHVSIATDGIGPYEYQGTRCYDQGTPIVDSFNIDSISRQNGELFIHNKSIQMFKDYLTDNQHFRERILQEYR